MCYEAEMRTGQSRLRLHGGAYTLGLVPGLWELVAILALSLKKSHIYEVFVEFLEQRLAFKFLQLLLSYQSLYPRSNW